MIAEENKVSKRIVNRNVGDLSRNHAVFFQKIGYTFEQPSLLQEALTHRSSGFPNNERLEFLGDSVLNCAVSVLLYHHFPQLPEGDLTRLRSNFVNQQALYRLATTLEIGELILLGAGERKSGGHRRPSILSDALEAIIGAIFLESGFREVERVISQLYQSQLEGLDPDAFGKDPKTLLQEFLQGRKAALPEYHVLSVQGETGSQVFHVQCVVADFKIYAQGEGSSRRRAEQDAAHRAYALISSSRKS